MRGFPQELLIPLIFGAVLLVQFLYKQLRRKAAAIQAETAPWTDAPVPQRADPRPMTAHAADAPEPVEAPRAAPAAMAARASPSAHPHPRRFSRPGLMPDRRAVQDAVVTAAILQPCRAHRPHDVG